MTPIKNQIVTSLESLHVYMKVGVPDLEREHPQKITISFKLYQEEAEPIEDDDSKNYNCYATIAKEIKKYCISREFKLLEFLCFQLYKVIKVHSHKSTKVYVKVEKHDIQYDSMQFNAKAEYSDL